MKSIKSVLFVFLAMVLLLTACGAPVTEAPAQPAQPEQPAQSEQTAATEAPMVDPNAPVTGGTAIIGTPQEPGSLNPLLASASIEDAASSLTIEGLIQINAKGEYEAVLAEALPKVSDDNLLVTYKLRQGIKFSDGSDFNCADVKFTYDAILSDLSQASTSGYGDIESIECPDDYTAVMTYSYVYAPYLRLFSYIIPDTAGDLAGLDTWEFNRNPVGTGPWIVDNWSSGDNITFKKNPYYREEGKPYLDSLILKILPSREVGVQLLGTGEIQGLWDLTEADFPTLSQMESQGVSFAAAVTGENELLVLNFADPAIDAPADPAANPHPILGDLRVRQAIQYGIDKQKIVDALLYGNVKIGTSVLPTGLFACPQVPVDFSPDKAKALLEEAGWTVGADGIREKDGVRMTLKIATTTGNQLREQTEQVLVEMMKEIGIEMVIDNVPSDVLFAGWDSDGMRKHGKFDVLLYTTGPFGALDPDSHLFGNYHSARIPTADNEGSGNNYSRYINPEVDAAIDEAAGITDTAKRQELYCSVAANISKDLPRIFLYERLLISGFRTELQNFVVSPGPSDFTWGSQNWWIKP